MKKMKRLLAVVLTLCLVASLAVPTVFAAETIDSQTTLALTAGNTHETSWTAPSDGTVTVSITSVNPGIKFWFGDNLPKRATAAASYDYEVTAGTTYAFKICGYYDWADADATVSYDVTFTPAEGSGSETPVEKSEYIVSETALATGDNKLTLDATAVTTIYAYEPTEVGTYTFTAPEGAIVGYWGAGTWFLSNPNSTTNSCEWECTGVGQSAYIGVSGVDGEFTLTVTKSGTGSGTGEIVYAEYVNEHTPSSDVKALAEGLTLTEVNIQESHGAVLGTDGYYHLDSADGPVLFVDMITDEFDMTQAYYSAYGALTMRGKVDNNYYDFLTAMRAYASVLYTTDGIYPLTVDLINYIKGYGAYQGWYMTTMTPFAEIKAGTANEDTAWMVLCSYDPSYTTTVTPTPEEAVEGSMEKPFTLSAPSTLELAFTAENTEVWYVYTADQETTLSFTIGTPSDSTMPIYIDGYYDAASTGYGDVYNMGDTLDVPVAAGQSVYLKISTFGANEVAIDVALPTEPVEGDSAENPIIIIDENAEDNIITYTTPEQAAEETVYYAAHRIQNMILTITGSGNFVAYYGGTPYMAVNGVVTIPNFSAANMYTPAVVSIMGENAGTYSMTIASPVGDMMNPAELNTADWNGNTATILAGTQDGYYFTWTAPAAGTLTLTMADTNTAGWQLYAYNQTSYKQSETIYSNGEINNVVIEVAEGDLIQVVANTYDPENVYVAPAGDVVFDAFFEAKKGTETNPHYIYDTEGDTLAVIEYPTTVPAGETAYYQGQLSGTTMSIEAEGITVTVDGQEITAVNGVYTIVIPAAASTYQPNIITITNNGTTEGSYQMNFVYPAGSDMNPDVLEIGENVADINAGSQGYYYTWTATEDGTLTVIVSGDSWTYSVYNMTSYASTDTHWFNDSPVVSTETIDVKAGDVVQVLVNTYDPNNMWAAPAGEVTVEAIFVGLPGSSTNPIQVNVPEDLTSVEVAAGSETYIAVSPMLNGQVISIVGDENTYVIVNGYEIVPDANGIFSAYLDNAPVNQVIVGNTGEEDVELPAIIEYPLGSEQNPIVIESTEDFYAFETYPNSDVHYVVNSQLNGNYVYVAGLPGTTVVVNGVEAEVVDWELDEDVVAMGVVVYGAELTNTPVNHVIVYNESDEYGAHEIIVAPALAEEPADPTNPDTGDNSFMMLWIAVATVSVLGMAVVVLNKKRYA